MPLHAAAAPCHHLPSDPPPSESRGLSTTWRCRRRLTRRVLAVGAALEPLHALLEQVAADTPSIEKYKMEGDYGLGDVADPYVRACRAECMLAVLMLHLERAEVEFIDADRLEVLRDAPSGASVQAVRAKLGECLDDA